MQTLRIVPNLRSSVVEEMPAGQVLLFTSELGDADPALLAHPDVRPFSWPGLLQAVRDPDLELLEVAEPLWVGEWVRALRYIALVKVLRAVRPGRRRVRVATYAIENLDARERLSFRSLDARPVLGAAATRLAAVGLGLSLLLLDTVVFGTTGASENYRRAFGWSLRRARHTVLTPRLDACRVCGPLARAPRDRTVLVLGAPSARKGFPILTEAWERSGAVAEGWRMVVCDPAGEGEPDLPAGVSIRRRPPRGVVHELLRSSAVVAMPSVRLRRWREQIGLPLVEGLTHGCRVVTTTETGLADDLRGHPLVTLTTPGDPASLADGLRRAMDPRDDPASGDVPRPVGYTKRDVVAWWLARSDR